jgi:hypothetical protein
LATRHLRFNALNLTPNRTPSPIHRGGHPMPAPE